MNLTLTQAFERTKDLSGDLKAARAHEADCAADHQAKLRIAEIAGEAHEKATAHCIALEQEREQLADHIAALVRKAGEPLDLGQDEGGAATPPCPHDPPCPGKNCTVPEGWTASAFNSIFTEGADFQAQAMQNGLNRIGEIVDEARR